MISVAMITMNEESAVGPVIESIKEAVPDAEVLIVDSSKDRTPEIAESMGAKVIRQFPPRGYGRAMDLALRSASGDVIVTMDCDNTYPAEKIPEVAQFVLSGEYDMVDCSRLEKKPVAMPWPNFIVNKLFAWLASLLFFGHFTDLHSGMRAYSSKLISNIEWEPDGAALPVELLLKPYHEGFKVKTFFIDYHDRLGASKMNAVETSLWTVKRIMRIRFGGRR
jgi:glycosyltransferase involved in cell wall biosynthesis